MQPYPKRTLLTAALVLLLSAMYSNAQELVDLATPLCEVPGLAVAPPKPWYSVPIDSKDETVEGCQMIWEEGEQYMGIMRLVSFDTSKLPEDLSEWENFAIAFEAKVMADMNIKVGERIWKRESVPVSGDGFVNAKAVGFDAKLDGVTHKNEAHFLLFESATHKYVISNLTPAKSASPEVYQANTQAMSRLMQTLQHRP